jgi:hypothetical protein
MSKPDQSLKIRKLEYTSLREWLIESQNFCGLGSLEYIKYILRTREINETEEEGYYRAKLHLLYSLKEDITSNTIHPSSVKNFNKLLKRINATRDAVDSYEPRFV